MEWSHDYRRYRPTSWTEEAGDAFQDRGVIV